MQANQEAKVKRFEEEYENFVVGEEKEKLDALVYSSEFLYLMRNIVRVSCFKYFFWMKQIYIFKELRHVNCAKTPQELNDLGIDKATMPPSNKNQKSRFETSRDTFLPNWHQNTSINRLGGNRPNVRFSSLLQH